MSTQSALGSGAWVAIRRRTDPTHGERAPVPTGWDPTAAITGFVTDPVARMPGPDVGIPVPRVRRRSLGRSLARASLLLLVLGVAAGVGAVAPYLRYLDEADRAETAAAAAAAKLEQVTATSEARAARIATMRGRIAVLETEMVVLQQSKVRTVVETETVVEEVVLWVPSGEEIAVEITGFEGLIGIHDVQITQAYGFTDIVGIAVNESGHTLSYAQLGCTFLDEDGNVLANAITNKQGWAPEQSWGFTCSAQVDATGGILRVDEMS